MSKERRYRASHELSIPNRPVIAIWNASLFALRTGLSVVYPASF
jgi:hypothetical protein